MLADVDAAKARAMDAVTLAESTLEEAKRTLDTLNGIVCEAFNTFINCFQVKINSRT